MARSQSAGFSYFLPGQGQTKLQYASLIGKTMELKIQLAAFTAKTLLMLDIVQPDIKLLLKLFGG